MTMDLNTFSDDEREVLEPVTYEPVNSYKNGVWSGPIRAKTAFGDYAMLALQNPYNDKSYDDNTTASICGECFPIGCMDEFLPSEQDVIEQDVIFHAMDLDLDPLGLANYYLFDDQASSFSEWVPIGPMEFNSLVPGGLQLNRKNSLPCLQLGELSEEEQMVISTGQLTLASGHKKLLWGEHGLLGPQDDVVIVGSSDAHGKSGLIRGMTKKLKHQLAEFVDESGKGFKRKSSLSAAPAHAPGSSPATLITSLDSMMQAKLYSELEVMLCNTANGFILQQYYDRRISQASIDKVNAAWNAKNNHHVVEFRYDQATQRELIMANRRNIEFTGDSSRFPVVLQTNLQNWKKVAHEMSIRTFCLPDIAIRKHIHDILDIINMMNPSAETRQAFHDVTSWAYSQMLDKETAAHRQSEARMKRGF